MLHPLHHARTLCLVGLVVAALTASAHAAEIVTLRSGFTVTCARHEAVTDTTVRLYLRPSSSDYMDVSADAITAVDAVVEHQEAAPANAAHRPDTLLGRAGAAHNVNVDLLASVVQAESAGNARAVSRAGARGLMQLMPATAASLGVRDAFSPQQNVDAGSSYLDRLLTRYHDSLPLALAAYNAGSGAVDRYHGIPPYRETRLYVAKVIREFNRRSVLASLLQTSAGQ